MALELFGIVLIFYLSVVFNCIFYYFSSESEHGSLDLISNLAGLVNYNLSINMIHIKLMLCEFKED